MSLQTIKEKLHIERVRDQDLQGGGFWLVAIIVFIVALRSAKFLFKMALYVVAIGCVAAAIWSHLRN